MKNKRIITAALTGAGDTTKKADMSRLHQKKLRNLLLNQQKQVLQLHIFMFVTQRLVSSVTM